MSKDKLLQVLVRSQGGPIAGTNKELAGKAGLAPGQVTGALRDLEKAGLAFRRFGDKGQRFIYLAEDLHLADQAMHLDRKLTQAKSETWQEWRQRAETGEAPGDGLPGGPLLLHYCPDNKRFTINSKETYKKYLVSEHWRQVRKAVLILAGGKCMICGSSHGLNVHHNKKGYRHLWKESTGDLVLLCRDCHSLYHGRLG